MKHLKFFGGLAMMLAFATSSCSDGSEPGNVAENDEVRYLRVSIANAFSNSRADDDQFEDGVGIENVIGDMRMDFYDEAGNFITKADPSDMTFTTPDPADGNIEKIKQAIVKISLKKAQNLPAYVICYINPVNWGDESSVTNMVDLRNQERPDYKDGSGHFAMNNSCYYNAGVKVSGTAINKNAIYTSASGADAGTATVDIYVERYASKVQFTLNKDAGTGTGEAETGIFPYQKGTGEAAYELTFVPEKWAINADAPTMYAIKKFAVTVNGIVPSQNEVQAYLGTWTTWNEPERKRSYWSCSPAFFADKFPQVSDNILDNGGTSGRAEGDYKLKYYSYNDIVNNKGIDKFAAGADGTLPHTYALENTVGKPALGSLNPKAAVPSVVVVGNYKVKYGGNTVADNKTFYIYNEALYFDEATVVTGAKTILSAFVENQKILYVKKTVAGKDTYVLYDGTLDDVQAKFTVKHPEKGVRGDNLVLESSVALQLNGVPATNKLYYQPTSTSPYTEVTTTNLNAVNVLLWQQGGVASKYNNGKCYFSIPIEHLGMAENLTNRPKDANGKITWKGTTPPRVGDFGLVRNHVYTLQVKAVKGLATGIADPTDPLVPPMEEDEYHIKYKINILRWRVVPTQGGIIL